MPEHSFVPLPGERVAAFLSRVMESKGLLQRAVADRVILELEGQGGGASSRVSQTFVSDLVRGLPPPRTLHGRKPASADPRYAALARVLEVDVPAFLALVEAEQQAPAASSAAPAPATLRQQVLQWSRTIGTPVEVLEQLALAFTSAEELGSDETAITRLEELGNEAELEVFRALPPSPTPPQAGIARFAGGMEQGVRPDTIPVVLRLAARYVILEATAGSAAERQRLHRVLRAMGQFLALRYLRAPASMNAVIVRFPAMSRPQAARLELFGGTSRQAVQAQADEIRELPMDERERRGFRACRAGWAVLRESPHGERIFAADAPPPSDALALSRRWVRLGRAAGGR